MSSGQIDDFTPEDQLDPSFLGEGKQKRWWNKRSKEKQPQQEPDSNINNDSEEDRYVLVQILHVLVRTPARALVVFVRTPAVHRFTYREILTLSNSAL